MLKLEALKTELPQAKQTLSDLEESLGVPGLREKLADLKFEMATDGFWNDVDRAQKRTRLKAQLEKSLDEYDELARLLEETEARARERNRAEPKPEAPKEDPLAAMLREMERRARERLGRK